MSNCCGDIEDQMFCFQCEQTFNGTGCINKAGVCSKSNVVARLQDQLVCSLKSLCSVCNVLGKRADGKKEVPEDLEKFVPLAMFSTLTNVNFTEEDTLMYIVEALRYRDSLATKLTEDERATIPEKWLKWTIKGHTPLEVSKEALDPSSLAMIPARTKAYGKDIVQFQEIITYGIRGGLAYAHHANVLDVKTTSVFWKFVRLLGEVLTNEKLTADDLLKECLTCGEACYECMELLDKGNVSKYGNPEPTTVQWIKDAKDGSEKPGKCILISGHDLKELEELLKQTEGKDIYVYTHGEMLPSLSYPLLKKYAHLAGHYGTAWKNQRKEFAAFPGSIVMTTNCYIPALPSYQDNVFACEPVNGKGVRQVIQHSNYTEVIKRAQELPGFKKSEGSEYNHSLLIGFGHHAVVDTPVLDLIIDAIAQKKLRHVYLIGGCDGHEKERNQYTDLAKALPSDTLILTLACGKFKINGMDYGKIPGTELPRLVDVGQCNDAYSAVQIVLALCKRLGVSDPNDLPVTYVVTWFEQKAVAVLLALLYLGIKDIYLGPKIPAFIDDKLAETLKIHRFENVNTILKKCN